MGTLAGAGQSAPSLHTVRLAAEPACPPRAWAHPAAPDQPRQSGAGRGERDEQPTSVIPCQPGTAQQQPGQLSPQS